MSEEIVRRIADVVRAEGGQTLMVGGSVRDALINPYDSPKDYDLMVRGVPIERLISILPGRAELVGQSFGVIKTTIDGHTIDVALPRTERSMGIGHTDFDVCADPNLPIEKDLERRDFTMNAIAIDVITNTVYDPFDGRSDIANCIIKAVGNPAERFHEDALRMLRAARFVAKLGFMLDPGTNEAIQTHNHQVASVKLERVRDEMNGLLMGRYAASGIRFMVHTGLIEHVLPEWMESYVFVQNNPHHDKTVDEHVLEALSYAAGKDASLRARWAVLLHDIAKPRTYTVSDAGRGHFYGHEDVGAGMVIKILTRLKCPDAMISQVSKIVAEHLNPPRGATDKVLRRYSARMGELTEDAMMCREADLAAHAPPWAIHGPIIMADYRARIAALPEIQGFTAARLAVHGGDLMKEFDVVGAQIGKLKEAATKAVIDGEIPNEHEYVLGWLKERWKEILAEG
jgi:putative nucleotidyltransferase with HDIG domain